MVYELWGCSNHFNDMLLLWRRLEVTCSLTASVLWTVGHVSMATDNIFSLFQWHHAGEARLSETESALSHIQMCDTQLFTHNALRPFACIMIPLILYTLQNYKDFWALMSWTCHSAEITACHSHIQCLCTLTSYQYIIHEDLHSWHLLLNTDMMTNWMTSQILSSGSCLQFHSCVYQYYMLFVYVCLFIHSSSFTELLKVVDVWKSVYSRVSHRNRRWYKCFW